MKTVLSNEKVSLRALEPVDIDVVLQWENNTSLWQFGSTVAPMSRKILWDYIENYNPDIYASNQLSLMIDDANSGTTVGMVDFYDFDHHNRRCGIGILIGQEFQNSGYGTNAVEVICDYAGKFLGLHQLWAVVPVDNVFSIKLFQKNKFHVCGRMRSWLRRNNHYADAFIMQMLVGN